MQGKGRVMLERCARMELWLSRNSNPWRGSGALQINGIPILNPAGPLGEGQDATRCIGAAFRGLLGGWGLGGR
jgi:hypothetical protein